MLGATHRSIMLLLGAIRLLRSSYSMPVLALTRRSERIAEQHCILLPKVAIVQLCSACWMLVLTEKTTSEGHAAADRGQTVVQKAHNHGVQCLLDARADKDKADNEGTPLHLGARP